MKKKLIEVALPLDAINKASAREKSIRHGHPSTLHLWWARRPLAAARAVIFAQMVDDPSGYVDVLLSDTKKRRAAEREFKKRLAGTCSRSGHWTAMTRSPNRSRRWKEVIAEQEREPIVRPARRLGSLGEHHQRRGARTGAAPRFGRVGGGRAPRMQPIRVLGSCSIGKSSRPFTIRLPVEERSRWRRSGWDWKPMPAI